MNNTKKSVQSREDTSISEIGNAISSMPKESLKSLLYLVAGKQDSNFKLYHRPIYVDIKDIIDLNERIQEKFSHYQTSGIVTVDIMYDKNRATHFGTWAEFQTHNWQTSKRIESISIRWDFLLKMPEYPIPQRHTLTIKFVTRFDPMHFLHAMTSRDASELTEVEYSMAPIIARVDFISHLLSDELLNIVEEWVESRSEADIIIGWRKWVRSKRKNIARIFHYSLPTFAALISLAFITWFKGHLLTMSQLEASTITYMMYWMLCTGFFIPVFSILGRYLGHMINLSLENYNKHSLFVITNGDKAYQKTISSQNKKAFRGFITYSAWSIILDILACGISILIFKK